MSAEGRRQPTEHNPLNGGYLIDHSRPTPVRVQGARRSHEQAGDLAACSTT